MIQKFYRWMVISALCLCLLPLNRTANAQTSFQGLTNEVNHDIDIAIGVTAGVAGGLTIWAVYHHESQFIRGCAVSGPNGLELRSIGDQKTYELEGTTAAVKPGDNVRVHGKRKKAPKHSTGNPSFVVDKLTKDYGACPASMTSPQ